MQSRFLLVLSAVAAVVTACSGGTAELTPATAPADDASSPDAREEINAPSDDVNASPRDPSVADATADTVGPEAPVAPTDAASGETPDSTTTSGTSTIGAIYCPPSGAPYPAPLPANPQPTVVPITPPGGITFLEGPLWLADRGVLLFSEWTSGHRILQLTPPQAVEVFMPATGSNGLALTPDGKSMLMVTEMPAASVSRVSLADKGILPLAQAYNGQGFTQPNDLAVRADGTIYFSDYQAGRLYRRTAGGTLSLASSATHANGVGISPDETTLYLNADTHTVKYALAPDGSLGDGTDLASPFLGADGLAIDCAGNVYVAQNNGGSVVVLSPAGSKLGELGGLPKTVTNVAFGGPDRRTLYITTSSALYSIKLQVPGLPY